MTMICFIHRLPVPDESDLPECAECVRERIRGTACSSCGDLIPKSWGPSDSPRICLDCVVMGNTGWNEETNTWDWSA